MKKKAISILLVLASIFLESQTQNLQKEDSSTSDIIEIAIIGSNDLHGTAFPKKIRRTDNGEQYEYGGLVYAASLMKIIKDEYQGRVLYLDAGDQFQGGIQSSPEISKGQIMTDFFERVGLDGATLGNHEFDYSEDYLKKYLSKKTSPTIIANLESLDSNEGLFENQHSSKIFTVGGIKIGVIGLITDETKQGSTGFTEGKFPSYNFPDPSKTITQQSKKLRVEGAEIVLLVSHIGNYCPPNITFDLRTINTKQENCSFDELSKILEQVPEGAIDGIVAGHRHVFMHHYIKGIPFMGSINGGYYFNVLHIVYNRRLKQIQRTGIQGPVPVCGRIFKNTKLCNYHNEEQLKHAGALVGWKYHGVEVKPDEELQKVFDMKWKNKVRIYFENVFETQMLFERVIDVESDLANLITTMMVRGASKISNSTIDFAVINQGGFRSTWYPGSINLKEYYSMFSFDDNLMKFQVTGKQLKQIQEIIQRGRRGFYYFYGLKQTLRRVQIIDEQTGKTSVKKQFVNATLMDGSQIIDDKLYSIVSLNFLTGGGDDFKKVIQGFTDLQKNVEYGPIQLKNLSSLGVSRKIVLEELKEIQVIKKNEWSINQDDPWMTVLYE